MNAYNYDAVGRVTQYYQCTPYNCAGKGPAWEASYNYDLAGDVTKDDSADNLKRSPIGKIAEVKDVVDAVLYLTEPGQVTGEVLHVDGGAHSGKW